MPDVSQWPNIAAWIVALVAGLVSASVVSLVCYGLATRDLRRQTRLIVGLLERAGAKPIYDDHGHPIGIALTLQAEPGALTLLGSPATLTQETPGEPPTGTPPPPTGG